MTKISQLSDLGANLAADDEFIIRDVSDASTPNKKVTSSGFVDYIIAQGTGSGFTQIAAGAGPLAQALASSSGTTGTVTLSTALSGSPVERLRITPSGFVGINDNAPDSTLTIKAATSVVPLRVSGPASEFARIDTSGRFLIGTSAAAGNAKAQVVGGAGESWGSLRLSSTVDTGIPNNVACGQIDFGYLNGESGAQISANVDSGGGVAIGDRPTRLVFSTTADGSGSPTERMRITQAGKILLNATSTTYAAPTFGTRGEIEQTIATYNNGDVFVAFCSGTQGSASLRGYIITDGVSVLYSTASDARLKENIADAPDAGSLVDAVQVRSFDWKESGIHQEYGFVAQELLEVYPYAVSQPSSDDEERPLAVDYSQLVPLLVKEVQALRARVAALEGA